MITHAPRPADTLRVARTTHNAPPRTKGACEAAIAFGLTLDDVSAHAPKPQRFGLHLPLGALALIAGPSGSGKSTLLDDIHRAAERDGWTVVRPPLHARGPRVCVDRFKHKDVTDRLRALSAAGLAEARVAMRPPSTLSTGELERLRLGLAIAKAELLAKRRERVLLLIDELGAALDPATASSLASALARFVARNGRVRVAIATNRPDLSAELRPTSTLLLDNAGALRIERERTPIRPVDRFEIVPGTRQDLESLSKHHYRPGPPATVSRVLSAVEKRTGALAGVLATSMPTLNASWRSGAWDGRFEDDSKRIVAQRVNSTLRTISRVIVAPEFRASGLAVRLVRAYLSRPDTPCTEAIAAMGRVCPFFERAGMTPHEPPVPARDARLLDALEHAGVKERWRLATPDTTLQRAIDGAGISFVEREVRRWARDSRATASRVSEPLESLFERACRTLGSTPVVYTHATDRNTHHRKERAEATA